MHTMWLCLQCPGRFCELLPGNLETAEIIVKDIISQGLKSLPLIAVVDKIKIDFFPTKNMYVIQICIRYYECFKEFPDDSEEFEARIEGSVSQALLELFWEVFLDSLDC